ncbi:hypothetical protein V8F20_003890 [Naviculisporaceae sp. PSN 640]
MKQIWTSHMNKYERTSGSGKTAAYLIPILNKLMGKAQKFAASPRSPGQRGNSAGRISAPISRLTSSCLSEISREHPSPDQPAYKLLSERDPQGAPQP